MESDQERILQKNINSRNFNIEYNWWRSKIPINRDGAEFWYARELSKLLQYTEYNKFEKVIEKAKIACEESGNIIDDHFAHVSEMVKIGSSASRVLPILCKKYVINLTN